MHCIVQTGNICGVALLHRRVPAPRCFKLLYGLFEDKTILCSYIYVKLSIASDSKLNVILIKDVYVSCNCYSNMHHVVIVKAVCTTLRPCKHIQVQATCKQTSTHTRTHVHIRTHARTHTRTLLHDNCTV